jgi:hypothetical protein
VRCGIIAPPGVNPAAGARDGSDCVKKRRTHSGEIGMKKPLTAKPRLPNKPAFAEGPLDDMIARADRSRAAQFPYTDFSHAPAETPH